MVTVRLTGQPYGNHNGNGSIWFKCIVSLAFKPDATVMANQRKW